MFVRRNSPRLSRTTCGILDSHKNLQNHALSCSNLYRQTLRLNGKIQSFHSYHGRLYMLDH